MHLAECELGKMCALVSVRSAECAIVACVCALRESYKMCTLVRVHVAEFASGKMCLG